MLPTAVTPVARIHLVHLLQPRQQKDGSYKYSVRLLFPKGADLSALKKIAAEAAASKWGDKIPKDLHSPFRDQGTKDIKGYEPGAIFITARSKNKPGLINSKGQDIISPDDLYPGCYVMAEVAAGTYDTDGNRGVTFYLNHVMKVKDGERMGGDGFSSPQSAFSQFLEDSGQGNQSNAGGGIFD